MPIRKLNFKQSDGGIFSNITPGLWLEESSTDQTAHIDDMVARNCKIMDIKITKKGAVAILDIPAGYYKWLGLK